MQGEDNPPLVPIHLLPPTDICDGFVGVLVSQMPQFVIINLNRKPILRRTGRQPTWYRPGAKDAVLLQTQIEVMLGTTVLVQHERGTVPRIGGHAGTVLG